MRENFTGNFDIVVTMISVSPTGAAMEDRTYDLNVDLMIFVSDETCGGSVNVLKVQGGREGFLKDLTSHEYLRLKWSTKALVHRLYAGIGNQRLAPTSRISFDVTSVDFGPDTYVVEPK